MQLILVSVIFLIVPYFASALSGINLALQKTAWESNRNGHSARAVDGSRETNFFAEYQSCTHSIEYDNPWWTVDLGAVFSIESAVVVNRGDCCGERLHNFTIEAGVHYPVNNTFRGFKICSYYPHAASNGDELEFSCRSDVIGRYVKVQIYDIRSILTLCEVEVYGVLYEPTTQAEINSTSCQTAALTTATGTGLSTSATVTDKSSTSVNTDQHVTTDPQSTEILSPSGRSTHTNGTGYMNGSHSTSDRPSISPTSEQMTTRASSDFQPILTRCRCQKEHQHTRIVDTVEQTKKALHVNRNTTSRYKRRLECQSDTRKSSERIGIAGTLVLVVTSSVLLLFDILTVVCRPRIFASVSVGNGLAKM